MLERLAQTPGHQGTLVIQVVDAEPFVQFTGGAAGIEMDFPMITTAQRERKESLRRFFEARGLRTRATFGSNGGEFLDVDVLPDPARLTDITTTVLTDVFHVSRSAQLQFMGEGPGVAA
jgi:hypothetical protein